MTAITVGGYAIYCYLTLLGWIAVVTLWRQAILERLRARDEHHGADEAYGDELHRIRVLLSGPVPIVAGPAKPQRQPGPAWLAPTGPLPVITPAAVYGLPALLKPPAIVPAWRRWETPPDGVPVLTASGVAG